jgi:hypothetical protein
VSSTKAEIRALRALAEAQGWRVRRAKTNHWIFLAPDGVGTAWMPSTPSDHRTIRNTKADLRRMGLRIPRS